MGNFFYIIILLSVAVTYKAVSNYHYLRRIRKLHKLHDEYVLELAKPGGEANPQWTFVEKKHEIIELFKKAGVKDNFIPRMELVGFGHAARQTLSTFSNLYNDDHEIQTAVRHFFHEAEGVYWQRIHESINPFYWIETVLFLPAKLAQYIGAPSGSWITRAANVIGWLATIAALVFSLPDFEDMRTSFSSWLKEATTWVSTLF